MSRRSWALFALVSLLWGIPYLFIKVAVVELPPVWVSFGRILLAAAILVPIAWRQGALLPLRGRLGWLAAQSALSMGVPFTLIAAGEERIGSGLAGLLVATMPAFVAVIAWVAPARAGRSVRSADERSADVRSAGERSADVRSAGERLTRRRVAGLALGLAGVAVLVGPSAARGGELVGAAAVLLAAVAYAAGAVLTARRFAGVPPMGLTAGSLGASAVMLAPFAAPDLPARLPPVTVLGSLAVLGIACTALPFVGYFALIGRSGAGQASLIAYVAPTVAAGLGVLVLDEPLTWTLLAGTASVLAGSWLASRRSGGGSTPPAGGARRHPENASTSPVACAAVRAG